jgi:hypothetical protein
MWFTDRCSRLAEYWAGASIAVVFQPRPVHHRRRFRAADGPFLTGISRARDELAMSLPRITNLHEKLLCHNEVRRSYCDVASAVLENLALNRDVYTGVDYTSLTHATQCRPGAAWPGLDIEFLASSLQSRYASSNSSAACRSETHSRKLTQRWRVQSKHFIAR